MRKRGTYSAEKVAKRLALVSAVAVIGVAAFTLANQARAAGDHAGHSHGPDAACKPAATAKEAKKRHSIVVQVAGPGTLMEEIALPGEIKLNQDRVAHLAPRVVGIVREVGKTVGDEVTVGEPLAELDSAELGEAKAGYLAKLNEVGCCKILIPRLQEVHDNTLTLLAFLNGGPTREELRKFADLPMGGNRSKLIGSYSELLLSRKSHAREHSLYAKEIASEQDLLAAENALEKTEAHYMAERDSIAFEIRRGLAEAQAELRRAEFELKQAERHVQFLGVKAEDIQLLAELVNGASGSECTDPDCTDCRAANSPEAKAARAARRAETEGKLTKYVLAAPLTGMIIAKHIALGEHVSLDSDVFTIADLSTVWVDLRIHERHLSAVREGQEVTIQGRSGLPDARGTIGFIHPVIEPDTRAALARVILTNSGHRLRPGMFVTAIVAGEENEAAVVVKTDAVQYVGDSPVVFVEEGDQFKPREVILGNSRGGSVEIVFGLQAGERVAVKNSFRLKAELAKKTAGAAGGCASHAH
ncbi:MAG: efflux RND transporter periplasmic adaptor subunit [Lentisphaerae bacterium]|nr:efflux RND transporter periplasmic adaptor subunit [Lentisphaerota bacterium]MBT4816811.1 efflux RND transporter periplasmic adaptor subunit [Lentisphaerota bacterium]MBT5607681.1 efflux RND transporter periplasmic adaptor subunit [Lentisphaerota bacterium]MBT7056039.1 efflux RND transporter periplasmic adaptor subunit [Lentisphaerota bacterium]MBT7847371.1 efflux RND transporter periplasmic adaptor subunit [Lentisphaerota bacterium]